MLSGEARLGALSIAWSVPPTLPEAAGGLEHLASAPGGRRVRWSVEIAEPASPLDHHHAFFGDVRVRFEGDAARVVGDDTSFLVDAEGARGRVRARASLAAMVALHVLATHGGLAHVHAALVRLDGRTLLAPGGSGAGKTSFALAIAAAGGELLADDVVYVDRELVAWPVRRPPHVTDATLGAHVLDVLGPVKDGLLPKVRVRSPHDGPAMPTRVDGIVLPSIAGAVTQLTSADDVDVFRTLVGSSAFAMIDQAPGQAAVLDILARLAELPAARLDAAPDALASPRVIADAIQRWRP